MNFKKIVINSLASAMVVGFASCNDINSDDNTSYLPVYRTIVTVSSVSSTGTTFTGCEKDDMPEIVYTTSQTLNAEKVKPGMRMGIEYQVQPDAKQWASGPITLLGLSGCYGDGKEMPIAKAEDAENWNSERLTDAYVWRTGKYLNAMILASGGLTAMKCNFTVDEETLSSETPEIHLIYQPDYTSVANAYIYFLSYDLSALVTSQGAENATSVKVIYNHQGSDKTVDFTIPSTPEFGK